MSSFSMSELGLLVLLNPFAVQLSGNAQHHSGNRTAFSHDNSWRHRPSPKSHCDSVDGDFFSGMKYELEVSGLMGFFLGVTIHMKFDHARRPTMSSSLLLLLVAAYEP